MNSAFNQCEDSGFTIGGFRSLNFEIEWENNNGEEYILSKMMRILSNTSKPKIIEIAVSWDIHCQRSVILNIIKDIAHKYCSFNTKKNPKRNESMIEIKKSDSISNSFSNSTTVTPKENNISSIKLKLNIKALYIEDDDDDDDQPLLLNNRSKAKDIHQYIEQQSHFNHIPIINDFTRVSSSSSSNNTPKTIANLCRVSSLDSKHNIPQKRMRPQLNRKQSNIKKYLQHKFSKSEISSNTSKMSLNTSKISLNVKIDTETSDMNMDDVYIELLKKRAEINTKLFFADNTPTSVNTDSDPYSMIDNDIQLTEIGKCLAFEELLSILCHKKVENTVIKIECVDSQSMKHMLHLILKYKNYLQLDNISCVWLHGKYLHEFPIIVKSAFNSSFFKSDENVDNLTCDEYIEAVESIPGISYSLSWPTKKIPPTAPHLKLCLSSILSEIAINKGLNFDNNKKRVFK